jgi:glycosyltransferase involved in cell wall biosynthesis
LWLRTQGPYLPNLIDYLKQYGKKYRAFIFFTARYYPSALGITINPASSILVPTLHNERAMYRPAFHYVFRKPAAIMYNTAAEMRLAISLYGPDISNGVVCGVGVDVEPSSMQTIDNVLHRFKLQRNGYLLYIGRIDNAKGCDVLLNYFVKLGDANLKLVLVGKPSKPIAAHKNVILTGFLNDEDKNALIMSALALTVPSKYESLSLVLLESFALGTPALVNTACEVLKDHITASKAGYMFGSYAEFRACVEKLLNLPQEQRNQLADAGKAYVLQNYLWPTVIENFKAAIDQIHASQPVLPHNHIA